MANPPSPRLGLGEIARYHAEMDDAESRFHCEWSEFLFELNAALTEWREARNVTPATLATQVPHACR